VTYDKILEVRDPAELIPPRVLRESIKSIVADKAHCLCHRSARARLRMLPRGVIGAPELRGLGGGMCSTLVSVKRLE